MKKSFLEKILKNINSRNKTFLIKNLKNGDEWIFENISQIPNFSPSLKEKFFKLLYEEKSGIVKDSETFFIHAFIPKPRIAIVGAVHIAQPLSIIAANSGFDVMVIDPRSAFSTRKRFPNSKITSDWPDDALKKYNPDKRTAIVTLTHDPKLDDAALNIALKSDAFYIGSLGSKTTHSGRLNRLKRSGFTKDTISRIYGPVGLDIGAKSPAEIAVAIMAQIIQVRK